MMGPSLLAPNSLKNVAIGISVSESPDIERLGLHEAHFRLAVAEIARCVFVSGGHLVYGGNLQSSGYTIFLMDQVHRYGRRDDPLTLVLSWPEHRKLKISEIKEMRIELGLFGRFIYLSADGSAIEPAEGRTEEPPPLLEKEEEEASLTSLRRFIALNTHGRVFIGGKRAGFLGRLPGVLEEAIIAVRAGQPLFLAGGFGGVTLDIIRALHPDHGYWFPESPSETALIIDALEELKSVVRSADWDGSNNGLTSEENMRLAATHRPSDIAALVSLGLGRLWSTTPRA